MKELGREIDRGRARSPGSRTRRVLLWGLVAAAGAAGCTRSYYRDFADRDVYRILNNRLMDWRWNLPKRKVEADPTSRMADPKDPNHEPIPPDEPAARPFQVSSAFPFEFHGWKKRGTEPVEFLDWQRNVPAGSDGRLLLSRDSIMREAVVNSREYQFNYEDLYLSALSLTLAQFQFMIQGFSRNGLFFQHFGNTRNDSNQLQLSTDTGFTRQFMSGAQLLVDFANTVVFEYSGKGFNVAGPNLAINFTQPLLRGAWARIATQALSLQERGVLYAVRSFAHYRREFYVGLIAGNGYLGLLTQLQSIRNQEENLDSLERNLAQFEAELAGGFKSVLERDQIAQEYQSSQLSLLQAEAGLQTQIDLFKVQLGLPPEMAVRLDDAELDPFQLNDPKLDRLRTENQALFLSLLQADDAPKELLAEAGRRVGAGFAELEGVLKEARDELGRWRERLAAERGKGFKGPDAEEKKAFLARKLDLAKKIDETLQATGDSLDDDRERLGKLVARIDLAPTAESLRTLRDDLVNKALRSRLSEVFVAQTQARVYLIELKPVELTVDQAIQIALSNRLDLKNTLAQVTDAWRNEEVEANSLQGFLNFNYSTNLAAAPGHSTWFRFDSSASPHRVGITFDAPINRRIERNAYRASQITFQRSRRAYMQLRDEIVQQIRFDMRQLLLSRKQFDIGREQLITTSRQVEEAEYALQGDTEGRPVTLNLLRALQTLLSARNTLIATWINYETARMNLYRDFDLMDVDANGIWTNENDPELLPAALRIAAESPAFSLAIPAGVPDLGAAERDRDVIISDVKPADRVVPGEPRSGAGPLDDADLESDVAPPADGPPGPPPGPSPFGPPR
ncbi:TolC family protein [Paludisphaera mucosa]|uniref:TolC family protein n=1 Tax=Paludisphaera mucosa TaxID=3030827 RepID=A0ABT6F5M1_9BACT|nr:TolC family protein [Paludisphaera mucosa]MDG3002887.1 TolC family protein [Paludisphaera mucosa]